MIKWSEHTKHTLPFKYSNTTQDKANSVRRVSMIGKARSHEGTQGAQYSRLVGTFSDFVMVQRNLISF